MDSISLLFAIAIAVTPPPEASPRPVVIRGCSVLDAAAGEMLADRTVVFDVGIRIDHLLLSPDVAPR